VIKGTIHVLETSSTGEDKISSIHNANEIFGLKKKEDDEFSQRNRRAVTETAASLI